MDINESAIISFLNHLIHPIPSRKSDARFIYQVESILNASRMFSCAASATIGDIRAESS